eukprot:jgi/Mesen1/3283/ME001906S02385
MAILLHQPQQHIRASLDLTRLHKDTTCSGASSGDHLGGGLPQRQSARAPTGAGSHRVAAHVRARATKQGLQTAENTSKALEQQQQGQQQQGGEEEEWEEGWGEEEEAAFDSDYEEGSEEWEAQLLRTPQLTLGGGKPQRRVGGRRGKGHEVIQVAPLGWAARAQESARKVAELRGLEEEEEEDDVGLAAPEVQAAVRQMAAAAGFKNRLASLSQLGGYWGGLQGGTTIVGGGGKGKAGGGGAPSPNAGNALPAPPSSGSGSGAGSSGGLLPAATRWRSSVMWDSSQGAASVVVASDAPGGVLGGPAAEDDLALLEEDEFFDDDDNVNNIEDLCFDDDDDDEAAAAAAAAGWLVGTSRGEGARASSGSAEVGEGRRGGGGGGLEGSEEEEVDEDEEDEEGGVRVQSFPAVRSEQPLPLPFRQKGLRRDPYEVSRQLVAAQSVDEVVEVIAGVLEGAPPGAVGGGFNAVTAATALHRLARQVEAARLPESERLAVARRRHVVQLVRSACELLPMLGPQAVANVMWALSKIGGPLLYRREYGLLCGAARGHLAAFLPQHLANIAAALATARHVAPELTGSIARRAAAAAAAFRPQELSQLLWAMAVLGQPCPALFGALDRERRSFGRDGWTEQQLANVAWSCTVLGELARPSFRALWAEICTRSFAPEPARGHGPPAAVTRRGGGAARRAAGANGGAGPRHASDRHLSQLYQVMLSLELEAAPGAAALAVPEALRAATCDAWEKEQASAKKTSLCEKEVLRLLLPSGQTWVANHRAASHYSLDLALPALQFAIEWEELEGEQEQQAYLAELLQGLEALQVAALA